MILAHDFNLGIRGKQVIRQSHFNDFRSLNPFKIEHLKLNIPT